MLRRRKIGLEAWEFGWGLTVRSQEGLILDKRWALSSKVFQPTSAFLKIEFDFQRLDQHGKGGLYFGWGWGVVECRAKRGQWVTGVGSPGEAGQPTLVLYKGLKVLLPLCETRPQEPHSALWVVRVEVVGCGKKDSSFFLKKVGKTTLNAATFSAFSSASFLLEDGRYELVLLVRQGGAVGGVQQVHA